LSKHFSNINTTAARYVAVIIVLIIFLILFVNATQQSQTEPAQSHAKELDMDQQLIQSVRYADPRALYLLDNVSESALSQLADLATTDSNADVRKLALTCLTVTGGDQALRAFIGALNDDDPLVQAQALNGLKAHPDLRVSKHVLKAFDGEEEPEVRAELLFILGLMDGLNVDEVTKRCKKESDEEVKQVCTAALARLGDENARKQFLDEFKAAKGSDLEIKFEHAEYIKQAWLIPVLLEQLNNEEPFRWIGVDGRPDLPQNLRICDAAVNLIANITQKRFSFDISEAVNYTPEQRAEVWRSMQ
jgi:hypothetical protein